MIHLTPQQLSSYMDGELNEVSNELVRRHMETCEECTLKFAALEVQEEHLSHALVHEPGDEFFDRFAAEVERQLPAGKESASKRGSSSPASRAAALREAARRSAPSGPSPAGESEAEVEIVRPVAARAPEPKPEPPRVSASDDPDFDDDATLTALTADRPSSGMASEVRPPVSRPSPSKPPAPDPVRRSSERKAPPPPPPRRPAPRPVPRRPTVRRPAPSIPWYAAVILALIAGAAGVMVSRTDPVSTWLDSHVPSSLVPSRGKPAAVDTGVPVTAPEQGAPSQRVEESPSKEGARSTEEARPDDEASPPDESETSTQDFFEPEPQAAERFLPRASDPFADLSPINLAQVRAAQRSKAAADAKPSAPRFEAAAAEWERAVPLLRGARQQSLGRLELAASRYRAWEMAPTGARAASAAIAIRTYLTLAPQDAPRDVAKSWLARVSR